MGRARLAQVRADGLPDAQAGANAVGDRAVEQRPGFLRHAEAAGSERLIDILRSRAGQSNLEVVDDPRAVGGQGRHEPASHQVHQDGRQARLEHVGAKTPDDAPARASGLDQALDDGAEVARREDARQPVQPPSQAVAAAIGPREILGPSLALARRQRVGPDARQVELVVGEGHGGIIDRGSRLRREGGASRFALGGGSRLWHDGGALASLARRAHPLTRAASAPPRAEASLRRASAPPRAERARSTIRDSAGVAQLVRARGSYPRSPGFKSLHRHHCLDPEGAHSPSGQSLKFVKLDVPKPEA